MIDLAFTTDRIGALSTQMIPHALEAFARNAGFTLHLAATGSNDHHIAEAAFKALARALRSGRRRRCPSRWRAAPRGLVTRIAVIDHGAGNLVSIVQGSSDREP